MQGRKLLILAAAIFIGCAAPSTKETTLTQTSTGPSKDLSTETLFQEAEAGFKEFDHYLDAILSVTAKRNIENTLEPFNEFFFLVDRTYNNFNLISYVSPSKEMRDKAREMKVAIEAYLTRKIYLNPNLYKALNSVKLRTADAETKFFMKKVMRDFKRSGVTKKDEVRKKIAVLEEQLSQKMQMFEKNIAEDVRTLEVKDPAWLKGLPEDYLANHKPDANGVVKITTDYPDILPVLDYAENPQIKKEMFLLMNNRGYPQNVEVLKEILTIRHELAKLLGYSNHAAYKLEPYMVNSPAKASQLIERVVSASYGPAKKEYKDLLELKKKVDPQAKEVFNYERSYFLQQLKKSKLDFNPQEIRNYLEFNRVKQAVFDITSKLFNITYRPISDVKLWHSDVEAWEVWDNGAPIGRFYLDLYPRDGKYKHAAQITFRKGQKDKRLPEGTLVCNFPNPRQVNPALLDYDQAKTMLHEFGHLIHLILASRYHWYENTGHSGIEWDFIETPSQMLEEWFWDIPTLTSFAKHYKTGEPVPAELVQKLKASKDFGRGIFARSQMYLARLSLDIYSLNPKNLDVDALAKRTQQRISLFSFVEGTHQPYSFGHLMGYSAAYYTYIWSMIIAKDFFSEFEKKGLFDAKTAERYRKLVLEKGASVPADQLVRGFLGRSMSYGAFSKWLAGEESTTKRP